MSKNIQARKRRTQRPVIPFSSDGVQLELFVPKPDKTAEPATIEQAVVVQESLSEVRSRLQIWFALEWRRTAGALVQYGIGSLRRGIAWLESKHADDTPRFARLQAERAKHEKRRIVEVKNTLSSFLDELSERRRVLEEGESEEASRLLRVLQSRHDFLLREGAFLTSVPLQKLEDPGLMPLRKWRSHIEELARIGPPIIIPATDQALIRKRYDIERRSVQDCESFARTAAQRKIQNVRESGKNYRARLAAKRERRRLRLDWLKKMLERKVIEGTSWLEKNEAAEMRCVSEMNRYREIRLSRYLPRLFQ